MRKAIAGISGLCVAALAVTSATPVRARTFPPSPLPAPTGPHQVGRAEFDWTETLVADSSSPSGHREIAVWIWYPAVPGPGSESAEWMPGKWGELLLSHFFRKKPSAETAITEVEAGLQEHPVNTVRAHAYPDAPILRGDAKLPVLLFEPGFGNVPFFYTTLLEDLASHGFIVAAAIPTYYTHYNVFATERVIDTFISTHVNASLPFWTGDMIFTLNQLVKLDADAKSRFHRRLDFTRVGAFGHSFGGAASVQVAQEDERVRAALNLDGTLAGDVIHSGLRKPFLTFDHPHPGETDYHRDAVVFRRATPAFRLTLGGSDHSFAADFGFLPFIPASVKQGASGAIDPARALSITTAYVDAFFEEFLLGNKSPLLTGPSSKYPEVAFETNRK